MYNLLEAIRFAAVLLTPVIPSTCEKIFAQLGTDLTDYASIAAFASRKPGEKVGEASVLFSRLDEEKTLAEIAEAKGAEHTETQEKPEGLAEIAIDDFAKVELRCAEVVSCEPIPKAKKLLKLQLDLGYEKRQVASGIAKFYKPEELIGKKQISSPPFSAESKAAEWSSRPPTRKARSALYSSIPKRPTEPRSTDEVCRFSRALQRSSF